MQQEHTPNAADLGGPANTPSFPPQDPLATAADHRLEAETSAATATEEAGETARALAGRAEQGLNEGMAGAADTLQRAADRLDEAAERLEQGGGPRARAGAMAHGVADTMESVASYLRSNDVQGLRDDLERQVRERPLQTLAMGLAAGWLVGKILR